MDWKKFAESDLREFHFKLQSLARIREEIQALNLLASSPRTSSISAAPTFGGGSQYEDSIINAISKKERLKSNYAAVSKQVIGVYKALNGLTDDERNVLELFYMQPTRIDINDLCYKLNCSVSMAYSMRNSALKKFTLCKYGMCDSYPCGIILEKLRKTSPIICDIIR